MTRIGVPDPENPGPGGDLQDMDEALSEMASRLADRAGDDESTLGPGGASSQRTMPNIPDPRLRAAIEDIARLVELRRLVSDEVDDSSAQATPLKGRPESEHEFPARWGWFEPEERLGGGASGVVYKARDTHLGHHVALKLFHQECGQGVDLAALLMEGRQHALVKHPNIVVIHGADEYAGRVGIWMEHVEGITLRELVEERGGPRSPAEAVSIGVELSSALAAVHQRGLTHGDVKAQNVMRERATGRTVLMDFSSSRPANVEDSSSEVVGTPLYMAPELFNGGRTNDPCSDLYSLGVLLFYLLTGRYPYDGDNLGELKEALKRKRPLLLEDLRPDLPAGLADVVQKAIAPDPDRRFQSAGEFQQALRALGLPIGASSLDSNAAHPPQEEDLSSLVRMVRFFARAAVVITFLALIGYMNHVLYNVALGIPHAFAGTSLVAAVGTGLRSLAIPIVLGVIEIAAVVVLWALTVAVGRGAPKRLLQRTAGRLRQAGPDSLSTAFAVASVGAVALTAFSFRELWGVLVALLEADSYTVVDTTLLRVPCAWFGETLLFALGFSQVLLVLAAGWFVVFGTLTASRTRTAQVRVMKSISALAIVVGFVILCAPWRLLWWSRLPPVEIGDLKGYVVAQDQEALAIYAPDAPKGEPRHFVIPRNDARITKLGETPEYIFGEEQCEGGAAK
jgi:serine/threonine protein kinase